MKKLIVQFAYFTESKVGTDFRMCGLDDASCSGPYPSIHDLVIAAEKNEVLNDVIPRAANRPWPKQVASGNVPTSLSKKCGIVRAIVWTYGQAGLDRNALETLALARPEDQKFQPENQFWLFDPDAKAVLGRYETLSDALNEHERILSAMKITH